MNRTILHFRQNDFFTYLYRVKDPALCGKPVLVAYPGGRGRILAASSEAARDGVTPGMALWRARKLCPRAVVAPVDWPFFRKLSWQMFSLVAAASPLAERSGMDGVFIDYTGCERIGGPAPAAGGNLIGRLRDRLGFSAALGMGTNKLVSSAASRAAGGEQVLAVVPGQEQRFMAPFPVSYLPDLPRSMASMLGEMGISAVGELALFPEDVLLRVLGPSAGKRVYRYCRGIDAAPVRRSAAVAGTVTVRSFFHPDMIEKGKLEAELFRLAERVGGALRRRGEKARRVRLSAFYSDAHRVSRVTRLSAPSDLDTMIFSAAALRLDVFAARRVRFRGLALEAADLVPDTMQLSLFDDDPLTRDRNMFAAVDLIREKFEGDKSVFFGRVLHRPAPGG